MPNREYRAQQRFDMLWPSDWNELDGDKKAKLEQAFLADEANEREEKRVLGQFKRSNWMNLNLDQRVELCQKLENCLAYEGRREAYKVIPKNAPKPKANFAEIEIGDNPYKVIERVVHESCHADMHALFYKKDYAEKNPGFMEPYRQEVNKNGLMEEDVLIMRWETKNFVSPGASIQKTGNTNIFDMQIYEVDARLDSVKYLRAKSKIFEEDAHFHEYLGKKESDLKDLKELFEKKDTVNRWFADRYDRMGSSDMSAFTREDKEKITKVFRLKNFECNPSMVIKNLKEWNCEQQKESVKQVSLDQLLDRDDPLEGPSSRHPAQQAFSSPAKENKTKIRLG